MPGASPRDHERALYFHARARTVNKMKIYAARTCRHRDGNKVVRFEFFFSFFSSLWSFLFFISTKWLRFYFSFVELKYLGSRYVCK